MVALGIGRPFCQTVLMVGPQHSLMTLLQAVVKKKKKLFIPSTPSSPPHCLVAVTLPIPSRTWMPLYLATAVHPIRCRSLAPSRCKRFLPSLVACASAGGARFARRARRPPRRAKTGAGNGDARARAAGASAPARPSQARCWWRRWCLRATARCRLRPRRLE
jgi:hypothetical protein